MATVLRLILSGMFLVVALALRWLDSAQRLDYLKAHLPAAYALLVDPMTLNVLTFLGLSAVGWGVWQTLKHKKANAKPAQDLPINAIAQGLHGHESQTFTATSGGSINVHQSTSGIQSPAVIGAGSVNIRYDAAIHSSLPTPALGIETSRPVKNTLMVVGNGEEPAYNVRMTNIESDRYVLMAPPIEKVAKGDKWFLAMHSILKEDRDNPIFPLSANPDPFLIDKSEELEARFEVELTYTGARTADRYASRADVCWFRLTNEFSIVSFNGVHKLSSLERAPKLLPRYSGRGSDERLAFRNEGQTTAINVRVGSLSHGVQTHTVVTSPSAIPHIDPDQTGEVRRIIIEGTPGVSATFLSELLRSGTPTMVDRLTLSFEDAEGNEFSQEFDLTLQTDDSILFARHPLKLRRRGSSLG